MSRVVTAVAARVLLAPIAAPILAPQPPGAFPVVVPAGGVVAPATCCREAADGQRGVQGIKGHAHARP